MEWISIEKTPPPIGQEAVFLLKDGTKAVGVYIAHEHSKVTTWLQDWENSEYSHWLPLPENPKTSDK